MPFVNPQGADVSGFGYASGYSTPQSQTSSQRPARAPQRPAGAPQSVDINVSGPNPVSQATNVAGSVAAATAARQGVNALFSGGQAAPQIVSASRIPAAAAASGGGSATGGGAAAIPQAGVNPAIPIAVATIAGMLLEKHGEKYIGKPVVSAGKKILGTFGIGSKPRRPATPEELATSTLFERDIPGFGNLSEEQQAELLGALEQVAMVRNPGTASDSVDFTERAERAMRGTLIPSNYKMEITPGFIFGRHQFGKNMTLQNMLAFGARPGFSWVQDGASAGSGSMQPTADATWSQMTIPERLALLDRMEQGGVEIATEAAPRRNAYAQLVAALGGQSGNQ